MKRRQVKQRRLSLQPLETRRVLAASLGWDGPGLGAAELTYTINGSPNSLSQAETSTAIETAFNAWASAADITFTPTTQTGLRDSIDISFVNIDGTAGTLAQAYFPDDVNPARIAGDIQFDISESWEVGNSRGHAAFDLVWVAVHEIGHSLGLDHTGAIGSVLEPFVSANQSFSSLSSVDADAIGQLYAAADGNLTSDVDDTPAEDDPVSDDPVDETPTNNGDDSDTDLDDTNKGDTDDNPFPRNRWRWGGRWHRFVGRLDAELVNYNYINPTDVNGDNNTSALDALMIINQLSRWSSTDLSDVKSEGLCDVNADGAITALDALTVINAMSRNSSGTLASNTTIDEMNTEASETDDVVTENRISDDDVDQIGDDLVDEVDNPADGADGTETPIDDVDDTTDLIDDGGIIDESEDSDVDDTDDETCNHDVGHHQSERRIFRIFGRDAEKTVSRFDTDDDSSLSEDEVPERLWSKFTSMNADADGDGLVTTSELDAAFSTVWHDAFDEIDTDADGELIGTEVSQRFWKKISAADVDENGGVSFDELDAYVAEQQSERIEMGQRSRHRHSVDAVFASIGRIHGRNHFSRSR